MRCLVLANELRNHGASCDFICRSLDGNLINYIDSQGYRVHVLPNFTGASKQPFYFTSIYEEWLGVSWQEDACQVMNILDEELFDWLIVDNYALDVNWENAVSGIAKKIMVIDDLANRKHNCDLLLDVNHGRSAGDYKELLDKAETTILVGPRFSLLRIEFAHKRQHSLSRRESAFRLKNILITMGGVDEKNYTGEILKSINNAKLNSDPEINIKVVLGSSALWSSEVTRVASEMKWPTEVLMGVSNMAELMCDSDLAFGASGGTSWERCCLGLPTILFVTAENQKSGAAALQKSGAAILLDSCDEIPEVLKQLISEAPYFTSMKNLSYASRELVDGLGTEHVVKHLLQ